MRDAPSESRRVTARAAYRAANDLWFRTHPTLTYRVGQAGAPPPVPQKRQSWPLPPALQPTPGEVLQVGSKKHLFTLSHSSGHTAEGVVVVVVVVVAGHAGAPPPVSQKRQSWPLPPALQPTPPEVLQVGSTKHLFTPSLARTLYQKLGPLSKRAVE